MIALELERTIISKFTIYEDFPFDHISPELYDVITSSVSQLTLPSRKRIPPVIRMLECFLQITGQSLNIENLSDPVFADTYQKFIGAIYSDKFVQANTKSRYLYCNILNLLLYKLSEQIPCFRFSPIPISVRILTSEVKASVAIFRNTVLIKEKVIAWSGWRSRNAKGQYTYFRLYPIYLRFGDAFTNKLFLLCNSYFSARRGTRVPCLNSLIKFISEYPDDISPESFKNRTFISRFWREFYVFYVDKSYKDGKGSLSSTIITEWKSHFIFFIENYLIVSGLFAPPWGSLPYPRTHLVHGSRTHLEVEDGQEIRVKLLTPIPLHVTDEEAMRILFDRIESDVVIFEKWASNSARQTWNNYLNRINNASKGTHRELQLPGASRGKDNGWITSRTNINHIINAAATFSYHGYLTEKETTISLLYPEPLTQTAKELAIPTTNALLPHCVLLIAAHPEITPSFLENLTIADTNDKSTGFLKTDSGWLFDGIKMRRGSNNAQQTITLTPFTAEIINQIISLTAPLREYLRTRNDGDWRYLLLTSGKAFGYPSRMKYLSAATSIPLLKRILVNELADTSMLSEQARIDVVERFSLTSLRASAAVIVYLKTGSVEKMSRALGHKEYDPKLIDRYLPEPILNFFQDRWIRIFQTAILAEALKDSQYIFAATGLYTREDLNAFLNNHSLKSIPKHLLAPSKSKKEELSPHKNTEAIFGVDTEVLTALLNLQILVENADYQVSDSAKYWAKTSKHLIIHLENDFTNRPDIQAFLAEAKRNVNKSN